MVDEVAEILNISNDSAYRRIRGEKPISLEEMQKLATRFKISLDQFLHLQSDSFIFTGKLANATDHIFEKWMENLLQQVGFINSFSHKHMYYLAKDVPLMQQFLIPELIAFKSFFWRKSILHYEELKGQKFTLNTIEPRHIELSLKIIDVYNQIPVNRYLEYREHQ
jgi:plasmid maintenance system antidote protein VapI